MTNKHVLYGDTDSAYVLLEPYAKAHGIVLNADVAVALADSLQVRLQESLPAILERKFITNAVDIEILEPGREVVGRRALFKDKKKRYSLYIINNEGKPVDKIKTMGMETKRSDTPKFIQTFLDTCLTMVVKDAADYKAVVTVVDDFRVSFRGMDPWRRGSPGRVNKLTLATKRWAQWMDMDQRFLGTKKPLLHITVTAAMNTNMLMRQHNEHRWDMIRDGDKVEVIYLLPNAEQLDSVAIRVGETYVPDWFKALPFDNRKMEEKLLDRKLFNIIGDALGWDFAVPINHVADISEEDDDFYD